MGRFIDLSGMQFGSLTVIKKHDSDKNKNIRWECSCICGNIVNVYGDNLRRNHTTSCGCLKGSIITQKKTKHGHAMYKDYGVSPEYTAYYNMLTRCYNEKNNAKEYYLEKGILICDRWLSSFEYFLQDMGRRPSSNHSIDRIDSNGNYEPANCKWATLKEQAQNKGNNVWYEHDGVRMVQSDWAAKFGVTDNAIKWHLKKGKTFSQVYQHFMSAF